MDAFFLDPDVERLPPESTRITILRVVPLADNRRVHVWLELTPFQKRPGIELTLTAPDGRACASASIVEPMGWKLELTLHIAHRGPQPAPGTYTLTAVLTYPGLVELDRRTATLVIPPETK
jgi:hypothetical protein